MEQEYRPTDPEMDDETQECREVEEIICGAEQRVEDATDGDCEQPGWRRQRGVEQATC